MGDARGGVESRGAGPEASYEATSDEKVHTSPNEHERIRLTCG